MKSARLSHPNTLPAGTVIEHRGVHWLFEDAKAPTEPPLRITLSEFAKVEWVNETKSVFVAMRRQRGLDGTWSAWEPDTEWPVSGERTELSPQWRAGYEWGYEANGDATKLPWQRRVVEYVPRETVERGSA